MKKTKIKNVGNDIQHGNASWSIDGKTAKNFDKNMEFIGDRQEFMEKLVIVGQDSVKDNFQLKKIDEFLNFWDFFPLFGLREVFCGLHSPTAAWSSSADSGANSAAADRTRG